MATLVDFVAALKAHVAGGAAVTALIGERFTPLPVPEGQPKPRATYAITGAVLAETLDGDGDGLMNVHFQVDAWAATFDDALEIAEAIRVRLQSASFSPIPEAEDDNGRHLYDPETRLHRFHWRYTCQFPT